MEIFPRKNFLPDLWDDTQLEKICFSTNSHGSTFSSFPLQPRLLWYRGFTNFFHSFRRVGMLSRSNFIKWMLTHQFQQLGLSLTRQFGYFSSSAITSLDLDSTSQLLLCGCLNGELSLFKLDADVADSLHLPLSNVDNFAPEANSSPEFRSIAPFLSVRSNTSRSSNILCVKWYPFDNGLFATSGMDGCLKIWEPTRLEVITFFQCKTAIFSIDFCRCKLKSMLVCGLEDSSIRLCDLRLGSFCQVLLGHTGKITSVCWNPISAYEIASASSDQTVRVWDIRRCDSSLFMCDCLRSDFKFFQSRDHFDAHTISNLSHYNKKHFIANYDDLAFDGKKKSPRLSIPSEFKSEEALWGYVAGKGITQPKRAPAKINELAKATLNPMKIESVFSNDLKKSRAHSVYSEYHNFNHLISKCSQDFGDFPTRGYAHDGAVTGILYTPDGRNIVSSGSDRCIRLWNAENGRNCFVNFSDTKNEGDLTVQFSLDATGQFLFHAIKNDIKIFEIATGKEITLITGGHTKSIRSLLWNSAKHELYSGGSDGLLRIWSAGSEYLF